MRVLIVEDEPYMAEAIRDGLRLEAIAADIAGDGDTALELLSVNAYDIAVLDRDIPGPSGDEIAQRIVASGSGMPILMLTAADRLDDKATGFELGADDYLTKPFELRELVLRLRALDRRRAHNRPPVREIAGLRLDPFRREVYRDGRYVALTRKQFAVLEVLVAAEGGVVSAEELLERAWDENADPFTNAVRITVSALRKRLGEPWIIATVAGAGYRIDSATPREATVDRAPGLSVRLKLTLSYAGFLMVAGALLLAVVWVFLLRYVPDRAVLAAPGPVVRPTAPTSWAPSLRKAAIMLAFLLVFGLVGGWLLAGRMLAPLTASPTPRAWPRPDRSPTGSGWRAARTSSASSPTPSTPCSRGSRRTSPSSSDSPPTPPTSCAPRWRSRRRCSTSPARTRTATTASSSSASTPSTPGRSTSPRRCSLLSRADQRSFAREHVDLSLIAEEATETLLPLAEERGVTIETSGDATPTIGSPALLLQMATNLVHNAIVHNLPDQGTVWVTTSAHPESVVLTVENTGEKLTPQLVSTLAEPFQRGSRAHPHRPRGRRPRPGDRQEHHPGPRRDPHPRPPGRRRALASRWSCPPRNALSGSLPGRILVSDHRDKRGERDQRP